MRVAVLTVGAELLSGQVQDRNFFFLAERLAMEGLELFHHATVSDEVEELEKEIISSLAVADWVIATGGLGPTTDDVTREAVCGALGVSMRKDEALLARIRTLFRRRGLPMPPCNEAQAMMPEGGIALENLVGTAPGILFSWAGGKRLVLLPGPPREMIPLFEKHVLPKMLEELPELERPRSVLLRTTGLAESEIQERVSSINLRGISVAFRAAPGDILVTLSVEKSNGVAAKRLRKAAREVEKKLGPYAYGRGEDGLEKVTGRMLTSCKKTLSIAESCTGGYLAQRVTSVPGSSKYMCLGVVAYDNRIKTDVLRVRQETLSGHGAVSEAAAVQMARGVMRAGKSELGIGITGIAGPGGGSRSKPVGLVYIALAVPEGAVCEEHRFSGDREIVRLRSTQAALNLLRRYLLGLVELQPT